MECDLASSSDGGGCGSPTPAVAEPAQGQVVVKERRSPRHESKRRRSRSRGERFFGVAADREGRSRGRRPRGTHGRRPRGTVGGFAVRTAVDSAVIHNDVQHGLVLSLIHI